MFVNLLSRVYRVMRRAQAARRHRAAPYRLPPLPRQNQTQTLFTNITANTPYLKPLFTFKDTLSFIFNYFAFIIP